MLSSSDGCAQRGIAGTAQGQVAKQHVPFPVDVAFANKATALSLTAKDFLSPQIRFDAAVCVAGVYFVAGQCVTTRVLVLFYQMQMLADTKVVPPEHAPCRFGVGYPPSFLAKRVWVGLLHNEAVCRHIGSSSAQ
jgi:hypothetical protein